MVFTNFANGLRSNIVMDKKDRANHKQEIVEGNNHKKSFKERCKECGAIPLSQFEKEVMDAINEGYRKRGYII